jgi:DNA-binding CsgD family transcriptional regulator
MATRPAARPTVAARRARCQRFLLERYVELGRLEDAIAALVKLHKDDPRATGRSSGSGARWPQAPTRSIGGTSPFKRGRRRSQKPVGVKRRGGLSPDEVCARWPYLTPAEAGAVLLYERGLTHRAIAGALGISRASVRDRLDRAERRIRAHQRAQAAIPAPAPCSGTPNRRKGS